MADFLSHLVAQSQGNAEAVRPFIPPIFAQAPEFASDAAVPGSYNGAPQPAISSSLKPGSPLPDDEAHARLQGPDYRDLLADLVPPDMAHTPVPFPLLRPSITLPRVAAAEEASPSEQWSERDEVAAEPLTISEAMLKAASVPAEERQAGLRAREHDSKSAVQARSTPAYSDNEALHAPGSSSTAPASHMSDNIQAAPVPPGPDRAIDGHSRPGPSFSHEETPTPAVNPAGLRLPDEQARVVDQRSTHGVIPSSLSLPIIQPARQEQAAAFSDEQDAQRAHARSLSPAHDDAMESPRASRESQAGHPLHPAMGTLQTAERLLPHEPEAPTHSERSFVSNTPGDGGKQDQPASPARSEQPHSLPPGEQAAQTNAVPMVVMPLEETGSFMQPPLPVVESSSTPHISPVTGKRQDDASGAATPPTSRRQLPAQSTPHTSALRTERPSTIVPAAQAQPTTREPERTRETFDERTISSASVRRAQIAGAGASPARRPIQPIEAQAIMPAPSHSAREAALFDDEHSTQRNRTQTIGNAADAETSATTFADQSLAAVQHERTHKIRSRENRQKRTSIDEREAIEPRVMAQAAHDPEQVYAQGEQITQIIRVNIGRVVVRATPAAPVSAATSRPAPRPALSLDEYLKQREGRPQ